jgi:hypothetical protein
MYSFEAQTWMGWVFLKLPIGYAGLLLNLARQSREQFAKLGSSA